MMLQEIFIRLFLVRGRRAHATDKVLKEDPWVSRPLF